MEIKSVKIRKLDSVSAIEINGEIIEHVLDYKFSSSAHGGTELELKIDISGAITEVELSTN